MSERSRANPVARALRRAARALERQPHLLSALAGDGWIEHLEHELEAWLGEGRALATSSATTALLTALRAVEVGPGDEVIVPSYGWVGAVGAIQLLGATPVWVDIEADTWQASPSSIRAALSRRTAAIVVPHLCGHPCAIDEISKLAQAHGVPLIEDVSQALGARVDGARVGTYGDLAVMSFGPGKLVAAGEGGALIARSDALWQRAVLVSQHPLRQRIDVDDPALRDFAGGGATVNFRIHPLAAFLAAEQFGELDDVIQLRRKRTACLRRYLGGLDGIRPAALPARHQEDGTALALALSRPWTTEEERGVFRDLGAMGCTLSPGPVGTPCHLRPGATGRQIETLRITESRCATGELFVRIEEPAAGEAGQNRASESSSSWSHGRDPSGEVPTWSF